MSSNQLATTVPAAIANVPENKQYLDTTKYNPVFYSQAVMDYLPKGVEMVPYKLELPDRDIWTKAKAGFLKQGEVMLSANAISRVAQAAGVTLKRVTDEVVTIKNATVLRIEYEAKMLLPDGTVLTEVGGKEEPYTPGVGHAREKTDTKARRNALRRLLVLPLTMDEHDVKKPMIVWKTIFKRGGEMDHIINAQEAAKTNAIKQLYGGTDVEVIDVPSEPVADVMDDLRDIIHTAQSPEELQAAGVAISEARLTSAESAQLREEYKTRQTQLQGA